MPGLSGAAYAVLARSGIAAALRRRDAAPILCFHNVVPDEISVVAADRSLHLGRSAFADIVGWLARAVTVIPLAELVARIRAGRTLRGTAALTFDDAYRGTIRHALPVLRDHGLPATVFVVATAAERPRHFWWDTVSPTAQARDRLLIELRGDGDEIRKAAPASPRDLGDDFLPADWTVLRSSFDAAITPGSHTLSHRNLSALSAAEAERELRESRDVIGERLARAVELASYPYGFATPDVMNASARAGYAGAVTLGFARAKRAHHLQALPRINVPAGLPLTVLQCWTAGVRLRRAPIRVAPDGAGTVPRGT